MHMLPIYFSPASLFASRFRRATGCNLPSLLLRRHIGQRLMSSSGYRQAVSNINKSKSHFLWFPHLSLFHYLQW